jgi:hypothetical protein
MNIDKKKYNQEHYRKNKEVILSKAKERYKSKNQGQSVIPLFPSKQIDLPTPPPPTPPKRPKSRLWLSKMPWAVVLIGVLVATISGFLFSETAKFYSEFDGQAGSAYLKAFILEGGVIAFSVLKGRTTVQRFTYRLMVTAIYAYSIWVVSGGVIQKALTQESIFQNNRQVISELEGEIFKISAVRDTYFSAKRLTAGLSVEENLKIFRQKLEKARAGAQGVPNSSVLWNTLLTLVVFRILAMASNLMLLRELGDFFRTRGEVWLKKF